MKVLSESYPTFAEIKEMLEARAKEGEGEMGYEQKNTLDYMEKFSKLTVKESLSLKKELMEKRLTEKQATLCANLLPKNPAELTLILQIDAEKVTQTPDDLKELLKVIKAGGKK